MNTFLSLVTLVSTLGLASAQVADNSTDTNATSSAAPPKSIPAVTVNTTVCVAEDPCTTLTPICTASPCVPVCNECDVTTVVVTALTTYCPEPTTLCTNEVCHTVTAPGTLTITDCPCTIATVVTRTAVATVAPQANDVGVAPSNGATTAAGSLMAIIAAFAASLL